MEAATTGPRGCCCSAAKARAELGAPSNVDRWIFPGPEPRSFAPKFNQGLSPAASTVLQRNAFKARNCTALSNHFKTFIRNDPSENPYRAAKRQASRPHSAAATMSRSSSRKRCQPPPIDPYTGKNLGVDPRFRQFNRTSCEISMTFKESTMEDPSGKAKTMYMAPVCGPGHAWFDRSHDKYFSVQISSTGDASQSKAMARPSSVPILGFRRS